MKVFVLHECENHGCCEADGEDFFSSQVYGVFATEKVAKEFKNKQRKLYKYAQITETEFYGE